MVPFEESHVAPDAVYLSKQVLHCDEVTYPGIEQ